jgi:hypothetical protein
MCQEILESRFYMLKVFHRALAHLILWTFLLARPQNHIFSLNVTVKCQYPLVCEGWSCQWNQLSKARDSTLWVPASDHNGYSFAKPPSSRCVSRSTCSKLIIPTRESWVVSGTKNHGSHGWGSRVNRMLKYAPFAIVKGYNFQFSSLTCPEADRTYPHCFFAPKLSISSCRTAWNLVDEYYKWDKPSTQYVRDACKVLSPGANQSDSPCSSELQAWRVVARQVVVVQDNVTAAIKRYYHVPNMNASHYGAIHIRRTDKVAPNSYSKVQPNGRRAEAMSYSACTYAEALCNMTCTSGLSVFVATDDTQAIVELKKCRLVRSRNWRIQTLKDYGPRRSSTRGEVYRLWAEIGVMIRATYVVATFSSNIGRLVQVLRDKPPSTMVSLDVPWRAG